MNSSQAISAGLRRYWASKPRGMGLAELRARTPEGTCPFCGDACKRRSQTKEAKRMRARTGGSEFYRTCGSPECHSAYFTYRARDARAKRPKESTP